MAFCLGRREFFSLLGGATIAWPLVAFAQKPDRMRRIGVLMSFGGKRSRGKGPAFRIHTGACGSGLVRRYKPADGCALGWRRRWQDSDFRERAGRHATRLDPRARDAGFITSEAAMGSKLLVLLMDIAPG